MLTIASFLEIIAILGQDSGRANDGPIQLPFPMQLNYLAMASCVTVKSKQLGSVLGKSWAVWTTKHIPFHGQIFRNNWL